jgi:hypothetical protein
MEVLHPAYRAALSHQYSIATLRVLSCLHSPGLRCSCCNVVRFCCDLEAYNLVMAITVTQIQIGLLKLNVVHGCTREMHSIKL